MEESILKSTKKILGLQDNYTAFDLDIMTHINAAFSTLNQLGIGPDGFMIEDDTTEWAALQLPQTQLGMVRTYVFLKVKMLFDPPSTSFVIDSFNRQIEQYEWRLNVSREATQWVDPNPASAPEESVW